MLSNLASGLRTLLSSAPALVGGTGQINSEFWRKKMFTHFKRMDLNGDGYVSRDDCKGLVRHLTAKGQLSQERAFQMQRLVVQLWEDFWCCGEDKGFDYLLPQEEFMNLMNNLLRLSDCKKQLEEPLGLLFDILDLDNNGVITLTEWTAYFDVIGLSASDANKTFSSCFSNKSEVGKAEFVSTGQSFFMTTDEKHSSKHMWGPILTPPTADVD